MKTWYILNRSLIYVSAALFCVAVLSAYSLSPDSTASGVEERTFIFNQDGTEWQVELKNGKIVDLYKDNNLLPRDEISKYEDFIMDRIESYDEEGFETGPYMTNFYFNMKDFRKEMENIKPFLNGNNFQFHFDSEKFKKDMENIPPHSAACI